MQGMPEGGKMDKSGKELRVRVIEAEPGRAESRRAAGRGRGAEAGVRLKRSGTGEPGRLRVAAYCRVSTEMESQEGSYETQISHYTQLILAEPEWELAGVYADRGISATSTRGREEFLRMIADCEAGRIGMIITKSISRFARNTLDCLQYVRRLRALGVAVLFEKEGINTLDAAGEVLITIMASLAQQESQSLSQNVKMGIRHRMQEGQGRVNTAEFLGYERPVRGGPLVVVPEEAEVVRRVFWEFLLGSSPDAIARKLEMDGVRTPGGGRHWYASTVRSMLGNEKYAGDLLLQKYYTPDFLTHRKCRNMGELPMYFVEGAHEAIVPRCVFDAARREAARRAAKAEPGGLRCGAPEALAGRLGCARCGRVLKRCKAQYGSTVWCCRNRASAQPVVRKTAACGLVPADEEELKALILQAFRALPNQLSRLEERFRAEPDIAAKVRLQSLIELGERLAGGQAGAAPQHPACAPPLPPSDLGAFLKSASAGFWRTQPWKGGLLSAFDDSFILRYLDKAAVDNSSITVSFKGGLDIVIARPHDLPCPQAENGL